MPGLRMGEQRWQGGLLALIGLLAGGVVGAATADRTTIGLGLAALLLGTLLLAVRPITFATLALVGVYLSLRLGGALGGGVSYSDALLAAAAFVALPSMLFSPELRRLRLAMAGLGVYLACLLPTVALHGADRAYLEFAHRLVLIAGSLVVGAWLTQQGAVRSALRSLLLVSCVVSVAAVIDTVRRGFGPAYPLGLNKNLAGALLGLVVVLVVVAPRELRLTRRWHAAAAVVVVLGLLATQSRGGMLAAATGLLLAFVLGWRSHGRSTRLLAVLAVASFAAFVTYSLNQELHQSAQDLNTSSIGVRRNVEKATRDIWRTSPVVGVGLKYFNDPSYGEFAQAANIVVDNELAESGVVGLVGFVVLQGACIWIGIRRRRDGPFLVAALGCVVGELMHGMVDIYWSAGVVTLPFIILGMALARPPQAEVQDDGNKIESTRDSTLVSS